ncbi:MAG TPA: DUF86 domain-containing protein [Methanospirillum sp.]|nr:DUF86 domain-containing protein [Methanospirillum sp.]
MKEGIYKRLEFALQGIFDICAIINRDLRLGVPENDQDIIVNLMHNGVIDGKTREILRDMNGFRNILVHQYGRIHDEMAYAIIIEHLDDLISFCTLMDHYLNN